MGTKAKREQGTNDLGKYGAKQPKDQGVPNISNKYKQTPINHTSLRNHAQL